MAEKELSLEPSVVLRVNGALLTSHQLDVLRAVHEEGSQNKAARKLGIATPVLNRYLRQIEAKIGFELLTATPRGTSLNEEGEKIASEYIALCQRLAPARGPVVGGTIISEELLLKALSKIDPDSKCDLTISDDARNLRDFQAGLMDLVVLDDPLDLYDLEGVMWQEVATDRLIHVDRGERYALFMYGAQRIGFRHLEASGTPYKVERTYRSLEMLSSSGLSYFVNESLALRKGLKIKSDTNPALLEHELNAVYRKETSFIRKLLVELQRAGKRV
jgi:DNA-binding transcriptional LysR family regulator